MMADLSQAVSSKAGWGMERGGGVGQPNGLEECGRTGVDK
jgi:methyl coenzyme M reductase subunit C